MKIVIDDNSCYFDTNANIKTIFIHYTGKGFIEDKTPQEYVLFLKNNVIIIHNNINTSPNIKNLFDYSGSIGIKHCFVIYLNGDRANIGVKSKKDPYVSDNLILKSESMTLLSEEMKNKDIVKVKKSSLKIKTLNNIHIQGQLFTGGGKKYYGDAHLHLEGDNIYKYMTGMEHSKSSRLLYPGINRDGVIKRAKISNRQTRYLQNYNIRK